MPATNAIQLDRLSLVTLALLLALASGGCVEAEPAAKDAEAATDAGAQVTDAEAQVVDADDEAEDASDLDANPPPPDGGRPEDASSDVDSQAVDTTDGDLPDADSTDTGAGEDAAVVDAGGFAVPPCATPNPSGEVLLELGENAGGPSAHVKVSGQRMLTQDLLGHWQLWDTSTWTILTRGERCVTLEGNTCPLQALDMAGDLIVFETASALELRATSDGHVVGSIPRTGRFGLAHDGSYVWTTTSTALETWSTSGAPITTRSGNYDASELWAGPAQIKVGAGPAGSNLIEFVSPQTGASTTSAAFTGSFHTWFEDGGRFFTYVIDGAGVNQNLIRVYSDAIVEEKQLVRERTGLWRDLEPLGGYGDYFWYTDTESWENRDMYDAPKEADVYLDVYQVSGPDTPIRSMWGGRILLPQRSGQTWRSIPPSTGFLYLEDRTFDLRGPVLQEVARPPTKGASFSLVAITQQGEMFGFTHPRYYFNFLSYSGAANYVKLPGSEWTRRGCGHVLAVAPGTGNLWAISFEGQTLVVDVQRRAVVQAVAHGSDRLALSSDGSTLMLQTAESGGDGVQSTIDNPLFQYDVATGELLRAFRYGGGAGSFVSFAVASGADRLAQVRQRTNSSPFEYVVTDLEGTNTYASYYTTDTPPEPLTHVAGGWPIFLSLSGQNLAISHPQNPGNNLSQQLEIHADGALIGTRPDATPYGWLSDSRLLVQANTESATEWQIVSPQGATLSRPPLPTSGWSGFDALEGGTLIHVLALRQTIEVASGNVVWSVPDGYTDSRANDAHVVYWLADGPDLRIATR